MSQKKKPKVEFEPDAHYFEIENTATVKENVSDNKILIKRVFKNNKDTILVSGYIGNKAPEMQFYVNVSQQHYMQVGQFDIICSKWDQRIQKLMFFKQENTSKNLIQLSNYFQRAFKRNCNKNEQRV